MDDLRIGVNPFRFAVATVAFGLLQGCLMTETAEEVDTPVSVDEDIQITGSVGDGPIVGAAMRVLANDGTVLAELNSGSTADYDVTVKTKGKNYPLSVDARDGTDLVTNMPPDFRLRGMVLEPSKKAVANINPYSTLAVEIARDLSGGVSKANVQTGETIAVNALNFGLSSLADTGPMTTSIGPDNVTEIVKASEATGELIRRVRDALGLAGDNVNGDVVMGRLGADLIDSLIDGAGGSRADARTAAIASVLAAQIALETMANELHVNGVDATASMTSAIGQVSPGASVTLDQVTATGPMLAQVMTGLAAATATGDPRIDVLRQAAAGLQPGLEPMLVRSLLPADYRQTLADAVNTIATGSNNLINSVNTITRTGDIDPITNQPPAIGGTPPTAVQAGSSYAFTPTASDPDGDTLTFNVFGLPAWATFDPSTGSITGNPNDAQVGLYSGISISVSDGAESASLPSFSIEVTAIPVVNSPPVISGTAPTSVQANSPYSFTPVASDPDGDALTFSAVAIPPWATLDPVNGNISGTPSDAQVGIYGGIVITVSDGTATASLPGFSIEVTPVPIVNSPPVISGSPAATVQANSLYTFTPTASDPDGDSLTFSASGLPGWAAINPSNGTVSGTPSDADVNVYSGITITVSDGAESAVLGPFSITVEAVSLGSATLNWTPPTENTDGSTLTDLAGYKIYWGQNGSYPNSVTLNNPGLTSYVVENLPVGTWDFVSTAFNTQGVESSFSNVATKVIQ